MYATDQSLLKTIPSSGWPVPWPRRRKYLKKKKKKLVATYIVRVLTGHLPSPAGLRRKEGSFEVQCGKLGQRVHGRVRSGTTGNEAGDEDGDKGLVPS